MTRPDESSPDTDPTIRDPSTPPGADGSSPATRGAGRSPATPQWIGAYRVLDVLGEGGMGSVYLAQQTEPVRRRVAIKLIRPGMDTKDVVARFDAERQALALMRHPNIAGVLDAGVTDDGRPFFVMEHVPGSPLTEYCDAVRLDLDGRLALFVQICSAVQHAHQKGIVHRDLKPSNILVVLEDHKPVPKIIDFGVAKAVHGRLSDVTIYTQVGEVLGTPAYMSPEQAGSDGIEIDSRTDVYSLGVVLFELLTGALPFDPTEILAGSSRGGGGGGGGGGAGGYFELQRRIREDDPPKPSTKVSTLGDRSRGIAQKRRTDRDHLHRTLRGDLDWIVLKALEKDRERRYATPSDLASDVERSLRHETISARPPSSLYQLRKFARRNRALVVGVAAVFVALAAGTAVSAWQAVRATSAEREAEARAIDARREADKAAAVRGFLEDMLASADPARARGPELTVREILDESARQIDGAAFAREPEIEASLRGTLGTTYRALGLYDASEPHLRRAVELTERVADDRPVEVADARVELAELWCKRGDYAAAEALIQPALTAYRVQLGDADVRVATALTLLADVRYNASAFEVAEQLHREALRIRRQQLGAHHRDVAQSLLSLAFVLEQMGRGAAAEPLCDEALGILLAAHAGPHPDLVGARNQLAELAQDRGDLSSAERHLREARRVARAVFGDEHPRVADVLWRLGGVLASKHDLDGAEPLLREALAMRRKLLGAPHRDVATALTSVARVCQRRRDLDGAAEHLREALAMRRELYGDVSAPVASSLADLGQLERARDNLAEAERLLREAIGMMDETRGAEAGALNGLHYQLGMVLQGQEDYRGAEQAFRENLRLCLQIHGDQHAAVANALNCLASLLFRKGDRAQAEQLIRQSLQMKRELLDDSHPSLLETIGNLAYLMDAGNRHADAEPLHREFVDKARELGSDRYGVSLAGGLGRLGTNLIAQEKWAEAEVVFRERLALFDADSGVGSDADSDSSPLKDPLKAASARRQVGVALTGQARFEDAESMLLAAWSALEHAPDASATDRRRTLERLVELYTAWGKDAAAARWRDALAALAPR